MYNQPCYQRETVMEVAAAACMLPLHFDAEVVVYLNFLLS